MIKWPKYCLFLLLVFITLSGISQVKRIGTPYVRNYNPGDIQSGTQTWGIDISPDGLAYFANNEGILEFDGNYWTTYPLPGDIIVRSVNATSDGKIFAGGFNQIGYFDASENGEMTYHSLTDLVPRPNQNFGEVWKIHELPYGIVFQSYKQLMIYRNGSINIIKAPGDFHFSFLVNSELYINDQKEGLYRLATDRLVKIPGVDRLKGQLIWSMIPKDDHILIATDNQGIFEFSGYDLEEWGQDYSEFFKKNQIYCGAAIGESVYAFGTIQNGIILCDVSGNIIQHINLDKGLQNNTVLSLCLDQYNNLWSGLDNGIDYVEINSPLTYFTYKSNLSAGYASVVHDGLLYFGTNRGVFYKEWDNLQDITGDQEFKLIEGTQGQVWELKVVDETLFCGHNNGIYIIEGNKANKVSDVQGGWTFVQPEGKNNILKTNNILICGTYTSLVKFEKINGEWSKGVEIKGFSESSRFLASAGPGMIWMSHGYIGAFRLHFTENYDSVRKVEIYNSKNGFPSDDNINVFEILGKPVFTTEDGIYKYDVRTNSFIPDEMMQAYFPRKDIQKLQMDIAGNIWYFTNTDAGVQRLQEDGTYVDVNVPFRELENRFIKYFQHVYPLDENNVFFGIQEGFAHYAPKFPKNYQQDLSSFIRRTVIVGRDTAIYKSAISELSIANPIPYKYNSLRFEFSANDFENPSRIQFSSFLEGHDTEWTPWQNKSVREFTNLHHGNHVFNVKAKNIFDTVSTVSTISFSIASPWYLKWWAFLMYTLCFLVFIFIMVIYVRFRMAKSKRHEEERQKRLFKDREKQLQTEALEAEKEVIRLRNEKLSADMKQKDKELANNTMQIIQRSKSLIAIKKELSKLAREVEDNNVSQHINILIRKVNREIDTENQWEVFETHFENVHEEFLKRLKAAFPDLTPREMKLCAYLRLNISSKEIATLMNISTRGVEISRYRLRKKLQLKHDTNLTEFIMTF